MSFTLSLAECSAALDVPLQTLAPSSAFSMQPGVDATPVIKQITVSGTPRLSLILRNQVRMTYDIPAGDSSFRGILFRMDPSNTVVAPSANDVNCIRVRILLDGKKVYDTVLDGTAPPEQFAIAIHTAQKLTIAVDQMLNGGSVGIAEGVFSPQPVPEAPTFHLLEQGKGYANLGDNVRQVAFHTYYPGESVSLQTEFNGPAKEAIAHLTFTSPNQANLTVVTLPVTLRSDSSSLSIGTTHWQVPSVLGPAQVNLRVEVGGKPVYQRESKIAIVREVDVSKESPSSTFGIHMSSAGIPYLTDAVANIWGAKWARIFLRWEVVEHERGQYDWRRIDELVDLYLTQNMQVLAVLGEVAPKWALPSGPETEAAFNRFAKAAVEHFSQKIHYWEMYNEVDSKYRGGVVMDKSDPAADIRLLRQEVNTIRAAQPDAKLVCCSTGTSYWLVYDKRLYDNGLLNSIDIVSLHPYQSGQPEEIEGAFSYPDMLGRLRQLDHRYGARKPVWSTEANWIIGQDGQKGVTAPYVDEHSQSAYLVRVNLLSMALGVPYFVHSPLFTQFHRELLLDSVASYANMTYNFGRATAARLLTIAEGIYGVAANEGSRSVVALWTTHKSAQVKVSGIRSVHVQDIYGNPVAYDVSHLSLSGDPIYLSGIGAPSVTVEDVAAVPRPQALPAPDTWSQSFFQKSSRTKEGLRIMTGRGTYSTLLKSPPIEVVANSCYRISMKIHTRGGGVALAAEDIATGKRIGPTVDIFSVTGNDDYEPGMTIRTASTTRLRLLLIADNPNGPDVSDFEISRPEISRCSAP